jgi:hypothetical protein
MLPHRSPGNTFLSSMFLSHYLRMQPRNAAGLVARPRHRLHCVSHLPRRESTSMRGVRLLPPEELAQHFVPVAYLPPGKDEYYLRDLQNPKPAGYWRRLASHEIETLVKNANTCDDWDAIRVADPFTPQLVKNCEFAGLVRIGPLKRVALEHHELRMPVGLTGSLIVACDLGENVAVHNVRYLAHFIVGDHVMLLNVDEMNTTNHAKFGNGIVKDGEPETVRIWLDLMNEAGGRSVMPFDGMLPADAYLWAKYRDDPDFLTRLGELTQRQFDSRRGYYGTIGPGCVIKNSGILKDVKIGPCCYIKGANKLKNLTLNSSAEEPTQIGEGVELVNGIVGPGCHVFYGCKAVRFVMGPNAKLKYGARLIHSYLGDNSTVSCCEILNNLVFPAHEQHHNNSFLIAALVMGQSNLAAGATLGSNHSSRANDGELQAGRGFWPGLCVTVKHPSRFASFVLLAQGSYPRELDIPLPFSLVSQDAARDRLLVMPAYWWLHNMYALQRNAWKFQARDHRRTKAQKIEFEALAPDTVEEIFRAQGLLERWTGRAWLRSRGELRDDAPAAQLAEVGRRLLSDPDSPLAALEILGEQMENSQRPVRLLKVREGYHAYRQMLHYYAVKNLLDYLTSHPQATLESMNEEGAGDREREWVNVGGQLVPRPEVDRLREDVRSGTLQSWSDIHQRYEELWSVYPEQKQRHAWGTLLTVLDVPRLTAPLWNRALDTAVEIQEYVRDQVYHTRRKDHEGPFRRLTSRNAAEQEAVFGTAERNSFVRQVREETEAFRGRVEAARR